MAWVSAALRWGVLLAATLVPKLEAQTSGGFTQPYGGSQPWSLEPEPHYMGLPKSYSVTKFSSVRLTGLPVDDAASRALGVYLAVDKDGDGVVDVMDGRPIYMQRDVRTVQPALNEVETGVQVGRHYLYYRYTLGGWAVHPTLGSHQALLFSSSDAAAAHEMHGERVWQRVEGSVFLPDRRLQLLNLHHESAVNSDTPFAPPGARLDLLLSRAEAAAAAVGALAPAGELCPQGTFREERTGTCEACPRGTFGDSNGLASAAGCAPCPPGTFRALPGGKTLWDCVNCTAGRYASSEGNEACGGACPIGKYSSRSGATDASSCVYCPRGYRSTQCDRKDNSKQAKRQREREKREKVKRSRQSAARSQAAVSCELDIELEMLELERSSTWDI